MSLHGELKKRLSQDFSADNLDRAATLCHEASWTASRPLGLFVVASVLRTLESQWDVEHLGDQAYMSKRAVSFMESSLRAPLLEYLDGAEAGDDTAEAETGSLNRIVRALFEWTAKRPPPRDEAGH